jgi:hypothetical protein
VTIKGLDSVPPPLLLREAMEKPSFVADSKLPSVYVSREKSVNKRDWANGNDFSCLVGTFRTPGTWKGS